MNKRLLWTVASALIIGIIATGGLLLVKRNTTRIAACQAVTTLEAGNASRRAAAIVEGKPLIAFLGDSYTQGQKLDDPIEAFPYVAAEALNASPLVNGRGGSGFVYDGPCANSTYSDRVEAIFNEQPQTLVIQGGINDLGRGGQEQAATALLNLASQRLPKANLVLVGPAAAPGVSRAEVDATAEGMSRAAEKAGAEFVDLRELPIEFLPDRVHATEAGHAVIGKELAGVIGN